MSSAEMTEKMTKDPYRRAVIEDCLRLVDEEVKSKGGISGLAVKGAYNVVKAVKPRFVPDVVDAMLDDWVAKLAPFYDQWETAGGGKSFSDYLGGRRGEVAEQLLQVVDGRARNAKTASVKKMYEKMRPSAKKHVEEAIPNLGRLVEKRIKS